MVALTSRSHDEEGLSWSPCQSAFSSTVLSRPARLRFLTP